MNTGKIAICVAALVVAMPLRAVDDNDEKTVKIGEPIDSGFLFYDGKYIKSPYEFTRKGFSVFVNGHKIYFPEELSKYLLRNRNIGNVNIADIPKDITYEEFGDPEKPWAAYEDWMIKKIIKKYPKDYSNHLIDFYQSLPFVKKAFPDSELPNLIVVETFKGDKTWVDISGYFDDEEASNTTTKSDVEKMVVQECAVKNMEVLKKGGCVFLFSQVSEHWVLTPHDVKNNLPEIINVLKSSDSKNIKMSKLYRLRLFSKQQKDMAEILVDNFKLDEQLSDKIADILRERKTSNFKRVEIEKQPTREELVEVKKRAFKDAQERWRKEHPEEYKREQKAWKSYLEKMEYISKKDKKYWSEHKEELDKIIKEIKRLKNQIH